MDRGLRSRVTEVARRHWPLFVVLGLGALLRVLMYAAWAPAYLDYPDVWGYVKGAAEDIFVPDVRRPAGSAGFLSRRHEVRPSLKLVIGGQHLRGMATAVIAYAITLRAGASRWVAIIPAAVASLSLDFIFLEHQPLSETLCAALLFGSLLMVLVALQADTAAWGTRAAVTRFLLPLLGAGLAMGAAITVRTSSLFAAATFAILVPLLLRRPILQRLAGLAAFAIPATAIVLIYMAAQSSTTGHYALVPGSGWSMYTRVAPFADCSEFDPPAGTRALCETTNPDDRDGGNFYAFDAETPARDLYERLGVDHLEIAPRLQDWSLAALKAQPEDYVSEVMADLWHYVTPYSDQQRPAGGGTPDDVAIDVPYLQGRELDLSVTAPYYGVAEVDESAGMAHTLADLQRVLRFHGPLMLLALLLAIAGLILGRREERRAIALFSAVGFLIPIASVATVIWGWRYAVPVQPAMAGAGAIGGVAVFRARSLRSAASKQRRSEERDENNH